ncbi:putative glycerophosphocholine phosphodiesterase [Monocercomonoides exilis]|uniref:putative glycerophosphocholine phosphodiesterase n=1 Tax=Monocercomonoides exilis TaxID=2049356 RepID=UPI0035594EC8|nr:putative glycerophosphocholine phosphodiesterase [Monocercomonoides exilis]|eukprot:MONOS_12734.1-p1 / transcript=MONOS_12734.1 / gene=MONOS_12734 / organism=Monocercomonoides_exilis_PA203 / gene_product=glycerophosphocholine phosphodiesterase [3.1.4.2] / transcript_product=glycerophosphocholine phosphodiesterase [3.1.4.2] / location=Mono_scaffold00726:18467-24192(+) / protein_length=1892 / sequence_SO=supercontig / SO=protein_coding / is_pseudo=false
MPSISFHVRIPLQIRDLFRTELTLKLFGSAGKLGLFRVENAVQMKPTKDFAAYSLKIEIPPMLPLLYKTVISRGSEFVGEEFFSHFVQVEEQPISITYSLFEGLPIPTIDEYLIPHSTSKIATLLPVLRRQIITKLPDDPGNLPSSLRFKPLEHGVEIRIVISSLLIVDPVLREKEENGQIMLQTKDSFGEYLIPIPLPLEPIDSFIFRCSSLQSFLFRAQIIARKSSSEQQSMIMCQLDLPGYEFEEEHFQKVVAFLPTRSLRETKMNEEELARRGTTEQIIHPTFSAHASISVTTITPFMKGKLSRKIKKEKAKDKDREKKAEMPRLKGQTSERKAKDLTDKNGPLTKESEYSTTFRSCKQEGQPAECLQDSRKTADTCSASALSPVQHQSLPLSPTSVEVSTSPANEGEQGNLPLIPVSSSTSAPTASSSSSVSSSSSNSSHSMSSPFVPNYLSTSYSSSLSSSPFIMASHFDSAFMGSSTSSLPSTATSSSSSDSFAQKSSFLEGKANAPIVMPPTLLQNSSSSSSSSSPSSSAEDSSVCDEMIPSAIPPTIGEELGSTKDALTTAPPILLDPNSPTAFSSSSSASSSSSLTNPPPSSSSSSSLSMARTGSSHMTHSGSNQIMFVSLAKNERGSRDKKWETDKKREREKKRSLSKKELKEISEGNAEEKKSYAISIGSAEHSSRSASHAHKEDNSDDEETASSLSCSSSSSSSSSPPVPTPSTKGFIDVGHRGSGANARSSTSIRRPTIKENTLPSFLMAYKHKVEWVEFDIHLSADKIPVLTHDFMVPLTNKINMPVCRLSARQFCSMRRLYTRRADVPIRRQTGIPYSSAGVGSFPRFYDEIYETIARSSNKKRRMEREGELEVEAMEAKEQEEEREREGRRKREEKERKMRKKQQKMEERERRRRRADYENQSENASGSLSSEMSYSSATDPSSASASSSSSSSFSHSSSHSSSSSSNDSSDFDGDREPLYEADGFEQFVYPHYTHVTHIIKEREEILKLFSENSNHNKADGVHPNGNQMKSEEMKQAEVPATSYSVVHRQSAECPMPLKTSGDDGNFIETQHSDADAVLDGCGINRKDDGAEADSEDESEKEVEVIGSKTSTSKLSLQLEQEFLGVGEEDRMKNGIGLGRYGRTKQERRERKKRREERERRRLESFNLSNSSSNANIGIAKKADESCAKLQMPTSEATSSPRSFADAASASLSIPSSPLSQPSSSSSTDGTHSNDSNASSCSKVSSSAYIATFNRSSVAPAPVKILRHSKESNSESEKDGENDSEKEEEEEEEKAEILPLPHISRLHQQTSNVRKSRSFTSLLFSSSSSSSPRTVATASAAAPFSPSAISPSVAPFPSEQPNSSAQSSPSSSSSSLPQSPSSSQQGFAMNSIGISLNLSDSNGPTPTNPSSSSSSSHHLLSTIPPLPQTQPSANTAYASLSATDTLQSAETSQSPSNPPALSRSAATSSSSSLSAFHRHHISRKFKGEADIPLVEPPPFSQFSSEPILINEEGEEFEGLTANALQPANKTAQNKNSASNATSSMLSPSVVSSSAFSSSPVISSPASNSSVSPSSPQSLGSSSSSSSSAAQTNSSTEISLTALAPQFSYSSLTASTSALPSSSSSSSANASEMSSNQSGIAITTTTTTTTTVALTSSTSSLEPSSNTLADSVPPSPSPFFPSPSNLSAASASFNKWEVSVDDDPLAFATLLSQTPKTLGLFIELKYCSRWFQNLHHFSLSSRNELVDAVLSAIVKYGQGRKKIVFTTFDPEVVVILKGKQSMFPVFLNTMHENIVEYESNCSFLCNDARVTTIHNSLLFAKREKCEGVCEYVNTLLSHPLMAIGARRNGMRMMTYGEKNVRQEVRDYQRIHLGVSAMICDNVQMVDREERKRRK